jgi:hypothetical protein
VNPIFAAALEIQRFCRNHSWPFCIIGGVAVGRWGEPRLTRDVDVSLLTGWGGERPIVDELLSGFTPRREDAKEFAFRHRVLLVQSSSGVPIDIALAAMPFEERAIQRASDYAIGGDESIVTCSAEDLIVFKVFAGRPQDWLDVEGIVTRQGDRLDRTQIEEELGPLLELKEDTDAALRLEALFHSAGT